MMGCLGRARCKPKSEYTSLVLVRLQSTRMLLCVRCGQSSNDHADFQDGPMLKSRYSSQRGCALTSQLINPGLGTHKQICGTLHQDEVCLIGCPTDQNGILATTSELCERTTNRQVFRHFMLPVALLMRPNICAEIQTPRRTTTPTPKHYQITYESHSLRCATAVLECISNDASSIDTRNSLSECPSNFRLPIDSYLNPCQQLIQQLGTFSTCTQRQKQKCAT